MWSPDTVLKALADATRLRCLLLLVAETELCVCEFGHALDVAQPKISRHLALLRSSMVLLDRKEGQWVYYRLHPQLPPWARALIQAVAVGAAGLQPYQDDLARLHAMPNRPSLCGVGGIITRER